MGGCVVEPWRRQLSLRACYRICIISALYVPRTPYVDWMRHFKHAHHAPIISCRGHKEIITTLSRFPLDPNMFVSGELACPLCVDEVWGVGCLKSGWVGRCGWLALC